MDKLDHRQLTLIKRAAEDAIHACNRHYGPFVDVVAHPLNIIALVEMAQSRQAEFDSMTEALLNQTQLLAKQKVEVEEKDKRIETLITTWRNQAKELCNVDDKHVREALLSCADELEVMRANNANS